MSKRFMLAIAVLIAAHSCGGCAAILPNYIAPEFEHMSHATQHEPLTNHPTHYGAEIASLVLHWDMPHAVSVELAEGVSLDRHYAQTPSYGELIGPREQFSGRIQYRFRVRD